MKLTKLNFELIVMLVMIVALKTVTTRAYKKVRIHIPMKVKHHHHTHTVVKHVHHQVPVHYDHHDVHVIHPTETVHEHEDYDDDSYHVGRFMGDLSHFSDSHYDRASDYENYDRYLRKRSKSKQKLFNNKVIGWKGRKDFDKIASEYLASLNRQSTPDHDDYEDHYAADDENRKKKRK